VSFLRSVARYRRIDKKFWKDLIRLLSYISHLFEVLENNWMYDACPESKFRSRVPAAQVAWAGCACVVMSQELRKLHQTNFQFSFLVYKFVILSWNEYENQNPASFEGQWSNFWMPKMFARLKFIGRFVKFMEKMLWAIEWREDGVGCSVKGGRCPRWSKWPPVLSHCRSAWPGEWEDSPCLSWVHI
jgi:hypothetical protein